MNGWRALSDYRTEYGETALWLRREERDGRLTLAQISFLTNVVPGQRQEPSLRMPEDQMREFLQAIVNEAARLGIVALDASTTMEAQRRHLEDMRAIALKSCGIEARGTK